MKLWRGRQVNNGASSQQIAPVDEPPKPKPEPVAPLPEPPTNADLLRAGEAPDKGNYTAAGQAVQMHGSRSGSNFPEASGNEKAINAQGQQVLSDIVNDPAATRTTRHHARFGDILEVKQPDGRGARFSADGNTFIGFIEPNP